MKVLGRKDNLTDNIVYKELSNEEKYYIVFLDYLFDENKVIAFISDEKWNMVVLDKNGWLCIQEEEEEKEEKEENKDSKGISKGKSTLIFCNDKTPKINTCIHYELLKAILKKMKSEWQLLFENNTYDEEDKKIAEENIISIVKELEKKNNPRIKSIENYAIMFYEEIEVINSESSSDSGIRIDLHHYHLKELLPKIFVKEKEKSKITEKAEEKKQKEIKTKSKSKNLTDKELITILQSNENWIRKNWANKILSLRISLIDKEKEKKRFNQLKKVVSKNKKQQDKVYNEILQILELEDSYGERDEPKLRYIIDSIINDMISNRVSNKLILGPQGTGKSSFAVLLSKLMDARLLVIECGPTTDNQDLIGSYEIKIDPETKQAVTVFHENGLLYASKLVSEGEQVIVVFEEYNLLASEALLKQLNRCFQDRILATLGGRYEIDVSNHASDFIIILTGNFCPGQPWLEDVGLLRRFQLFSLELPSTKAVKKVLQNYIVSPYSERKLTSEAAERIAEIRDDLVASLEEKSIKPIMNDEVRYPDLYTLRNFAIDLLHDVSPEESTDRHLVKIILGGKPFDEDLLEDYEQYREIIQQTVIDRLPSRIYE